MQLTELQHDALCEIMNIASGRAAAALSGIITRHVEMRVIEVRVLDLPGLEAYLTNELGAIGSVVSQGFSGALNGTALFLLTHEHAAVLVRSLLEEDRQLSSLTTAEQTVLTEVGNIVLSSTVAVITNQMGERVTFQFPHVEINVQGEVLVENITAPWEGDASGIVMTSHMTVGKVEIIAHIMIVLMMPDETVERLLASMLGG